MNRINSLTQQIFEENKIVGMSVAVADKDNLLKTFN